MNIEKFDTKSAMGKKAAADAADKIKETLAAKGAVNIILATGASQFDTLEALVAAEGIDWSKVSMFHLDEYIGMDDQHPASFRKYLKERFIEKVPGLKAAYLIDGDSDDLQGEINRLNEVISQHPIDVALVGIGENGHLAFNDPPANFEVEDPYIVVDLDEKCRKQQMGEGWFPTLEDVPAQAVSMSIRQIMKSSHIICSVPDERKAEAVRDCTEKGVSNIHPASVLQNHKSCTLYLDKGSASMI